MSQTPTWCLAWTLSACPSLLVTLPTDPSTGGRGAGRRSPLQWSVTSGATAVRRTDRCSSPRVHPGGTSPALPAALAQNPHSSSRSRTPPGNPGSPLLPAARAAIPEEQPMSAERGEVRGGRAGRLLATPPARRSSPAAKARTGFLLALVRTVGFK